MGMNNEYSLEPLPVHYDFTTTFYNFKKDLVQLIDSRCEELVVKMATSLGCNDLAVLEGNDPTYTTHKLFIMGAQQKSHSVFLIKL